LASRVLHTGVCRIPDNIFQPRIQQWAKILVVYTKALDDNQLFLDPLFTAYWSRSVHYFVVALFVY